MSNFEEFKQKAKDTMETLADRSIELYRAAEEKTRLLAKTTKLAAEITLEKGSLRRLHREIGQKYYELHKEAPEPVFEQMCTEVTTTLERIAAKKKEMEALKKEYEDARCGGGEPPSGIEVEIVFSDFSDEGKPETASSPEAAEPSGETPENTAENATPEDNAAHIPPPPHM